MLSGFRDLVFMGLQLQQQNTDNPNSKVPEVLKPGDVGP